MCIAVGFVDFGKGDSLVKNEAGRNCGIDRGFRLTAGIYATDGVDRRRTVILLLTLLHLNPNTHNLHFVFSLQYRHQYSQPSSP